MTSRIPQTYTPGGVGRARRSVGRSVAPHGSSPSTPYGQEPPILPREKKDGRSLCVPCTSGVPLLVMRRARRPIMMRPNG
jgi:hypothetical protein